MNLWELTAPCHFGTEAVLKREILDLGYEVTRVEDGRVTFEADAQGVADANLFLRTTERVLLKVGEVKAETFDELFEKTKALPWENYIPKNGKFWVAKANSIKSKLFSPSDIQSIMKKAIVERLKGIYGISWFPEDGPEFPIRVAFMKDVALIGIDTSGVSLHKRGYRQMTVKAPITETLASALLMLTPWKKDRILVDPFCGSGTFPIEAAMMAADMAPGLNRHFLAESWEHLIPKECWEDAREEARERVNLDIETDIQGFDIDAAAIKAARANAKMAGVDRLIHFQQRPVSELRHSKPFGFIVTNPPYGERIEEKSNLPALYREIGESYKGLDRWSMYLITAYDKAENDIGRKADKKAVDEKEIHGPAEKLPGMTGDAIARRTKGRHQGGGNCHTGDNVAYLLFPCSSDNSCKAAENGYQDIPYSRRGSGQQLVGRRGYRRQHKIYGGYHHTEHHLEGKLHKRMSDICHVIGGNPVAYIHNPAHERRNQHCPYNNSGTVHIQSNGSDKHG